MTFLEAVVEISKRPDLQLCPDKEEQNGTRTSLCVYKTVGGFVGKLRWPDPKWGGAHADDELVQELVSGVSGPSFLPGPQSPLMAAKSRSQIKVDVSRNSLAVSIVARGNPI